MTQPKKIIVEKDGYSREFPDEPHINVQPAIDRLLLHGWRIISEAPPQPKGPPPPKPMDSSGAGPILLLRESVKNLQGQPLVSVIMPAWNAEPYISAAIACMQDQSLTDWELCIVDDGSDDTTFHRAQWAAGGDERIVIHRIPHGGYAVATCCALALSSGAIIARLDADDTQHCDRLRAQVDYLLAHPAVDCVTCEMTDLKLRNGRWGQAAETHTGPMVPERYVQGWGGPCHASIVAWRRVYDMLGGFLPDEEWDGDGGWNLRGIRQNVTWGHIDEPWYYHRRYPEMRSERFRDEQNGMHADLLAGFQGAVA